MTVTTDLETLSDAELIERAQGAIWSSACLNSRGIVDCVFHREIDALYAECRRRTPNGRLYIIAYNRASAGIVTPTPVPPDRRS